MSHDEPTTPSRPSGGEPAPRGVDEEIPERRKPLRGSQGGASFGADGGSTASVSEDLQEAFEPDPEDLQGSRGGASFGADDGSTAAVADGDPSEERNRDESSQDSDSRRKAG